MSLVGKHAPDFTLEGYHNGEFTTTNLTIVSYKWYVFYDICPLIMKALITNSCSKGLTTIKIDQ